MVAAAISAAAAAASAGASIYGTATRDNSGPATQAALTQQGLQDARDNQYYQELLSSLVNRRSVAGQTDSFGSGMQYDPGSNTWVSKLGPLPLAADTAAMQAGVRQNTTGARLTEAANEQSALRAARAAPAADEAQRNLSNFRPMGRDALTGVLQNRATTAANETFRPIVQDTLRNYSRTGVNAGPVLSALGRTQADNLRKTLMDAQISGMTGVDQVNESRRTGLENAATTATSFANPQFQSTTIAPSGNQKALTDLLQSRVYGSSTAPAYGAGGVNTAAGNTRGALDALVKQAGVVPANPAADIGKDLALLGQNEKFGKTVAGWFGSDTSNKPTSSGAFGGDTELG